MISCQDADVLAAALSVGSIDRDDQAALQQHLAGCADCRRVAGEYMAAAARLPLALQTLVPSPDVRTRLMRAVYAESASADRATASGTATWWRRLWAGVPAGRGFTILSAACAVAVIALASWSLVTRPSSTPAPVAVTLSATTAAPDAHGRLVYDRGGDQAVLTVDGLPAPTIAKGAAVYEVWLIRRDGSAVPAAYLSKEPNGTWSAALSGDMSAYTAVAATVEPPGGSPVPTGAKVILGSLSGS